MKILVADDDAVYRRLLEKSLRKWGYETVSVPDGTQAMAALLAEQGPRLALLDWHMPGMDGVDICRRLKRSSDLPFVYAILLTSRDAQEDMVLGLEAGADDYLVKPVDLKMLRTRLMVAGRIVEAVPPREWALPRVPGYEVKRLIGKGTAGSVWEAVESTTSRRVAMKLIRLDLVTEEVRGRFLREIDIVRRLRHPNVVPIYDSHADDTLCYFTMELVDGSDLARLVASECLPVNRVLELMAGVCDGVEHAHRHGVVHRDLKPQNILVTREGLAKVADFGLAKLTVEGLSPEEGVEEGVQTLQGSALGSPLYMAPEQASGHSFQVDARSDVYTLGVILYIMAVRRHPHKLDRASQWTIMRSIVNGEVRPPGTLQPDIDPQLERIIMKALAKRPEQRYPSAGPMGDALRDLLAR